MLHTDGCSVWSHICLPRKTPPAIAESCGESKRLDAREFPEAIASGKPVVAFPMFADQYANAWLLDIFGMGKTVDEEALTMDPSSGKRRMMRVVGIRNGTTELPPSP